MSYQVLARKYRPRTFTEVVGQDHILKALENSLINNRLHHAYLFSGTRGVGKTSIARLFAKCLNCETGITAQPCDICNNCVAITNGNFPDVIEIDAASRTKVEDTRELLENIQYQPTIGRFKIYIIDEVHMLSKHSFNALLKTLEEPPEYVKFLLATTDPEQLPITILSRCLQFHFQALEPEQIYEHLTKILQIEKIPFENEAIHQIAKFAQGSVRDALSLTDQAIALSNGNISFEIIAKMLGILDQHYPEELVASILNANATRAMELVAKIAMQGVDWLKLVDSLSEILHKIAMLQLVKDSYASDTVKFLAGTIAPEDLQLIYQIIIKGKEDLVLASTPRFGFEMLVLRALAFNPKNINLHHQLKQAPINQISEPKKELPEKSQEITKNLRITDPLLNDATQAIAELTNQQKNLVKSEKKTPEFKVENPIPAVVEKIEPVKTEPKQISKAPKEEYSWKWLDPELEKLHTKDLENTAKNIFHSLEHRELLTQKIIALAIKEDFWSELITKLDLSPWAKQIALNSVVIKNEDKLSLMIKSNQIIDNKEYREELKKALKKQGFKANFVEFDDTCKLNTPFEIRQQIFDRLQENAKNKLEQDPLLQELLTTFNTQLQKNAICPLTID